MDLELCWKLCITFVLELDRGWHSLRHPRNASSTDKLSGTGDGNIEMKPEVLREDIRVATLCYVARPAVLTETPKNRGFSRGCKYTMNRFTSKRGTRPMGSLKGGTIVPPD